MLLKGRATPELVRIQAEQAPAEIFQQGRSADAAQGH